MTSIRRITAAILALGLLPTLLGCSSGLDLPNSELPTPAISQGAAVSVCGAAAGSATLTLSAVGTGIVVGAPNQLPTDRVHLVGSSTGLDPSTHSVLLFLVPVNTDCPAYEQAVATLLADGSFSGDVELDDTLVALRAVAVAIPTGAAVSCGSTDACIAAPGYLAASNALEIRP